MAGRHRDWGVHAVGWRERYMVIMTGGEFLRSWYVHGRGSTQVYEGLTSPNPVWVNGVATR
jgi:hypothetical protein